VTANIASYTAETQSVIDYMAANAGVAVDGRDPGGCDG
jgi:hypothetical protein